MYLKIIFTELISDIMFLSIVVPCFNEEESVNVFYHETSKILKDIEYEVKNLTFLSIRLLQFPF